MFSSKKKPKSKLRRLIRIGFVTWAIFVFSYLFSGYRTLEIPAEYFTESASLSIIDSDNALILDKSKATKALIFLCGSGVSADAYVPLLWPITDYGYSVYIVKLPLRFAPLDSHKRNALDRVATIIQGNSQVTSWAIGGHSLGGALAARFVKRNPKMASGLILVGTTHPKKDDLSKISVPVTKIVGSKDHIAPLQKIEKNRRLLPPSTHYLKIDGANHVQFAHYAYQFLDGEAEISREQQQLLTRQAILGALKRI